MSISRAPNEDERVFPSIAQAEEKDIKTTYLSCLAGRKKHSILLILVGLTLVALTLLVLNQQVIQPAFQDLERQHALEDNDRVVAGINNELVGLVDMANDWSNWNAAYAFAQDRNPAFIASNYPSAAILSKNSGIDLLAFFDRQGQRLLQGIFHPSLGQDVPLQTLTGSTPPLLALIAPTFDHETPMEGLINTEYGILLLVARPILTSEKSGPAQGVLLMGRFLYETRIKSLAELTNVTVSLFPRHALIPSDQALFDRLIPTAANNQPALQGQSVYRLLTDIEKKPLALLQTPVHGEITALGRRTGRILSLALSSIALALLIGLAMYRCRIKISQEHLEESESRYRQLFELESDALFLIDNKTGRILEANSAAVNLYGYDHDDLLNRKNVDLSAEPKETHHITQGNRPVVDQVVTIPLRYHRKKDGTVFPVEITGRFFIHKGRPVHIAAIRDITARKQAEDQLRFTQFAIDHSADSAYWVNKEGRFIYINQEGCQALGYTKEELEGMTVADIDTDLPNGFWPHFWQELKIKKNMLLEGTHKTKDGRTFPVEIRANFVEFDGHEYNCGFVRDLTTRKMMEQEQAALELLNWQLQKQESLGRMAGAIAHHFNNQLTAVMGFLQLAMDRQQNKGLPRDQDLAKAEEAAHRAVKVSSLMLSYLGKTVSSRQPLDLVKVCKQYLPMLQALVPNKMALDTSFQSPGPIVCLNVEQIQQILTNLVTNSIEAFDALDDSSWLDINGWIGLDVKTVRSADIPAAHRFPVDWHPQDEMYARLAVTDTGGGIASEDIEKIFDPFYTSKFIGRGLGLSVALGLAKMHGGVITVESVPERGSIFQVFLPLHKG